MTEVLFDTAAGPLTVRLADNGSARFLLGLVNKGIYNGSVIDRIAPGVLAQISPFSIKGSPPVFTQFKADLPADSAAYTPGAVTLATSNIKSPPVASAGLCFLLGTIDDIPPVYPIVGVVQGSRDTIRALAVWPSVGNDRANPPIAVRTVTTT